MDAGADAHDVRRKILRKIRLTWENLLISTYSRKFLVVQGFYNMQISRAFIPLAELSLFLNKIQPIKDFDKTPHMVYLIY